LYDPNARYAGKMSKTANPEAIQGIVIVFFLEGKEVLMK
jgi:hypothetical protein